MDAGAFYGVHLPERVQNADIEVLQLRAKVEELEAQAQSHLFHRESASLEAAEELRRTREAHLAEIERLRDSRNEVLSSISVLSSLVDDVRREGGHDRLARNAGWKACSMRWIRIERWLLKRPAASRSTTVNSRPSWPNFASS